jgi:hypothetical protein
MYVQPSIIVDGTSCLHCKVLEIYSLNVRLSTNRDGQELGPESESLARYKSRQFIHLKYELNRYGTAKGTS